MSDNLVQRNRWEEGRKYRTYPPQLRDFSGPLLLESEMTSWVRTRSEKHGLENPERNSGQSRPLHGGGDSGLQERRLHIQSLPEEKTS